MTCGVPDETDVCETDVVFYVRLEVIAPFLCPLPAAHSLIDVTSQHSQVAALRRTVVSCFKPAPGRACEVTTFSSATDATP